MGLNMQKLKERYIFETHDRQTVQRWVQSLRYFSFKRAWGGHANDGDEFSVCFRLSDFTDLSENPEIRDSSTAEYFESILPKSTKSEKDKNVPIFHWEDPDIKTSKYFTVFGYKVFVILDSPYMTIQVSGTGIEDPFQVTEADFRVCLALEKEFDSLGWDKYLEKKDIQNNPCFITLSNYPEIFLSNE